MINMQGKCSICERDLFYHTKLELETCQAAVLKRHRDTYLSNIQPTPTGVE